jgi:hypothetical protein
MEESLYDEFGNYIGPEIRSSDEEESESEASEAAERSDDDESDRGEDNDDVDDGSRDLGGLLWSISS